MAHLVTFPSGEITRSRLTAAVLLHHSSTERDACRYNCDSHPLAVVPSWLYSVGLHQPAGDGPAWLFVGLCLRLPPPTPQPQMCLMCCDAERCSDSRAGSKPSAQLSPTHAKRDTKNGAAAAFLCHFVWPPPWIKSMAVNLSC